ncbi:MAG: LytTR family transcriptional regulator [Oscillospiraceae bacterium]|nr:LytTR family transcriptional regulator [Oscillospiraceae bacterium]
MRYKIVINSDQEEDILILAREKSELLDKLDALLSAEGQELLGFYEGKIIKLDTDNIFCFTVEDNKVFALTEKEKYVLKQRLYQLEESFGADFMKINQSCLVNITKIKSFDASIGGSLTVTLKNGYRDYISRRQLKFVKERIGF